MFNGNKRQIVQDYPSSTDFTVFGVYIKGSSRSRCQEQILPEHKLQSKQTWQTKRD